MTRSEEEWTRRLGPARASGFDAGFADRVMAQIPNGQPVAARVYVMRTAFAAAACVLLLVGFDGLREQSVVAPYGSEALARTLPDGSVVTLSAGTTLTYRKWPVQWMGPRRAADLIGEAYFDVASTGRPFVVRTFNAAVHVSGTRFNVRAWPASGETVAALEEGAIALEASGITERLPVLPGQVARVADRAPELASGALVSEESLWKEGGLAFRDAALTDVLRALERRYRLSITADDDLIRGRRSTYINPSPASAEAVLDAVAFALGLRYSRTANGFRLQPGSDQ